MKPFILVGIDKYHHARTVCLVLAKDLAEAARKLGGAVGAERRVTENSPDLLYFDRGQVAATFTPGEDTHETLAQAAGGEASQRLVAYYRYGTTNVYREYLLGSAMVVP